MENDKTKYIIALLQYINEESIWNYAFLLTNLAYMSKHNELNINGVTFNSKEISEMLQFAINEKSFFIDFFKHKTDLSGSTRNPRYRKQ